jgi:hypothetical protein
MFRLIVLIECDRCKEPFNRVATSTDRDPAAWDYLSPTLAARAEQRGWSLYSAHLCGCCITDIASETAQIAE